MGYSVCEERIEPDAERTTIMNSMVDGNPRVTIEVDRLGAEGKRLGKIETTYEELDRIGNHGAVEPPLDDNPDFHLPSTVAFAIWARMNDQAKEGQITTDSGLWHGYHWKVTANAA